MNRKIADGKLGGEILRLLAVALVTVVVAGAAGDGRVEKTFDATRDPRISLSNLKGHVLVRGWDKAQVHVVYTVASPRVEVDSEILPEAGPAERVHFETHLLDPALASSDQAIDYTLDVPSGSSVEIRNAQGKTVLEGIQADATLQSVGGDILVRDYSGHLSARSIAGDIEVIRPTGSIEVVSITGNLHFVSPATSRLHGSTTSGRVLYEGDLMPRGDYILSTYSGDLDIICPTRASYELRARTEKGKVINTLPMTRQRESASSLDMRRSLLGTHNSGRATLELTSFSGTIRIRPQE